MHLGQHQQSAVSVDTSQSACVWFFPLCDEGTAAGQGHGGMAAEGMDEGVARGAAQPGTWRRGGCGPDEGAA